MNGNSNKYRCVVAFTEKGDVFLIDKNVEELVLKHKWYKNKAGYITAWIDKKATSLHRLLMKPNKDMEVDHINHDKADCRLSNMRVCSNSENQANKKLMKNNKSGFKGVTWHKANKTWVARISYYGKRLNLGSFDKIEDAVSVYNKKALDLYGEYARI